MRIRMVLLLLATALFLGACGNKIETNMSEEMPDFTYTTQNDKTLGLDDLKGDWWISYFSYTHCTTVCPRTTANMVSIQEKLKEDGLTPEIVSFSIDPENDTPEILREYAKDYGADLDSMTFLTGFDFEEIQDLSQNTFKAVLEKGALGQRSHSFFFYLINPDGEIVKQYNGMSATDNDMLLDDMKTVLGK